MKIYSRLKLSLFLAIVVTMLFSSAAFAYGYTSNYYQSYYNNYNYYANSYYQPYTYNYSYYGWNNDYHKVQQKPAPVLEKQPEQEPTPAPVPTAGLSADEQKMINLINEERTSRGLQPLKIDTQLVKLARMKSQDMIDNNYFSHTSPTYGSPFEMMQDYGVSYKSAGENIAGSPDVARAHNNLMNSDGHRKNILNSGYTHIGVGIINGGPYGKMYTQLFIGK